uniref:F-box domain-containing protein n=1 Tax=Chenopodium quinoa TaxID=63459 RepID=A0A803KPT4_CHEQI
MELSQDVLIEILSRLPVKSLIRLSTVCKYWLSIIRSTDFATIHYATRLRLLSNNRQECDALLTTFFPACSISILSYDNLTLKTAFKFRPSAESDPPSFGISLRDIITDCYVYGPCNGLFLLQLTKAYENVLLLWNPATREVFSLPDVKHFRFFYVGFGYDDVTNDYKVVCFNRTEATTTAIVLLYSLAANSWRHVDAGFCFGPGRKSVVYGTPSTSNGRKHH